MLYAIVVPGLQVETGLTAVEVHDFMERGVYPAHSVFYRMRPPKFENGVYTRGDMVDPPIPLEKVE